MFNSGTVRTTVSLGAPPQPPNLEGRGMEKDIYLERMKGSRGRGRITVLYCRISNTAWVGSHLVSQQTLLYAGLCVRYQRDNNDENKLCISSGGAGQYANKHIRSGCVTKERGKVSTCWRPF